MGNDSGEDNSTERLYNLYGKKCKEYVTVVPAKIREKFDEVLEEGEALSGIKYDKLQTLRLWKCGIEDNGLRYICNYLTINKSVKVLEAMDNGITALGCEFLGGVLKKEVESSITTLKLDHNPLHAKGGEKLAEGLVMNLVIKIISLNYAEVEVVFIKDAKRWIKRQRCH